MDRHRAPLLTSQKATREVSTQRGTDLPSAALAVAEISRFGNVD